MLKGYSSENRQWVFFWQCCWAL